ncbi:hypothetical protein [Leucothrix arctica]|uniref:SoxXA-binding protein n=1 Tax=Leucothrix arctica TaxID=1481894 RepID=A0A317CI45_9GAMM|nr:hypothetical protein [Leucothrix arctica]PWQ95972.1 hypothetical protein DKT75_11380 [Leucothrix arctica]
MKLSITIAALALSLTAASLSAASLDDAQAAVKAAKTAGFPWTTTVNLLKKADKAEGDKQSTIIESIMLQTAASMKQAELAKKAGPRF